MVLREHASLRCRSNEFTADLPPLARGLTTRPDFLLAKLRILMELSTEKQTVRAQHLNVNFRKQSEYNHQM